MNARYVRRHFKPGKSRMRRNSRYPRAVWHGAPGSTQFFRGYPKAEIKGFRLESQLNRGFLAAHGIETPEDFVRLPELLIDQIGFFQVDWKKLTTYMHRHLRRPEDLLRMARRRSAVLTELLSFLRQVSISNPGRFLTPLPINAVIFEALQTWKNEWAAEWPAVPTRLRNSK